MSLQDTLSSVFGDKANLVFLIIAGIIAVVAIITFIMLMVYWKWVLLGGGIALVIAIILFILYKKGIIGGTTTKTEVK